MKSKIREYFHTVWKRLSCGVMKLASQSQQLNSQAQALPASRGRRLWRHLWRAMTSADAGGAPLRSNELALYVRVPRPSRVTCVVYVWRVLTRLLSSVLWPLFHLIVKCPCLCCYIINYMCVHVTLKRVSEEFVCKNRYLVFRKKIFF